MDKEMLEVRCFGGFSLSVSGRTLEEKDARSRKSWLLLAYLLLNRGRTVSQEELLGLLWSNEEKSNNPTSAMKTMIHRLRQMLDALDESLGRELLAARSGGYCWDCDRPMELDLQRFTELAKAVEQLEDPNLKLEKALKALALYRGDFLPHLCDEPLIAEAGQEYRKKYLELVELAAGFLGQQQHFGEMEDICRPAAASEPRNDALQTLYFTALMGVGDLGQLIAAYESLRDRLFTDYGAAPCEAVHSLYRRALQQTGSNRLVFDDIKEILREKDRRPGAKVCDFDYFKTICQVQLRFMLRSGDTAHIILLSVSGKPDRSPSPQSLARAMQNFGEVLQESLRSGDIAAPCSPYQYIVLLSQTGYANSKMVAERVVRSFLRRYPHTPAEIRFEVHPLSEDM